MKVNGPVAECDLNFTINLVHINRYFRSMYYIGKRSIHWKVMQLLEETYLSQMNQCSRANKQVCIRVEHLYHWHLTDKTIDTVSLFPSKICVKMYTIPAQSFLTKSSVFPWQKSLYQGSADTWEENSLPVGKYISLPVTYKLFSVLHCLL